MFNHFGNIRFQLKLRKPAVSKRLNKKSKFLYGPVSPNFCARRSVMMILNLSESLAKPLVMAKLNMAYLSSLKNRAKLLSLYLPVSLSSLKNRAKLSSLKNRAKLLSLYLPVSPSRVLRAPGTSPYHLVPKHLRATGLSNPTSFLRPALPMAPTRDDNARDKRSVLRPNPATFLRDFALYMKLKYAIIRKRCLNCSNI